MKKHMLLHSASIAALAIAGSAQAQGVDAGSKGFTLSVEGGVMLGKNRFDDKLGASGAPADKIGMEDELGYAGAIKLVRQTNSQWDWGVGVGMTNFLDNTVTVISSGGPSGGIAGLTSNFDAKTLDIERGYHPAGAANVRVFAGLRLANINSSTDKVGSLISGGPVASFDVEAETSFIGAGVRAGAEFEQQMGGSSFGFSGLIAGSALRGRQRNNLDIEVCSGGPCIRYPIQDTTTETVLDLEAQLGVDYHLGDAGKFTLGYQAHQFWNVGAIDDLVSDDFDDNLRQHGPFVKYTTSF